MKFDLAMTDELLATTRAVRKRLDLERPVSRATILECLELAIQAPSGGNRQTWRWMIVDDAALKAAIAEIYKAEAVKYFEQAGAEEASKHNDQVARIYSSSSWLAENLGRVPAFVIPCVEGQPDADPRPFMISAYYGSIFPAIWSFQLALRARGMGSTLTTLHLNQERRVAEMLGIPDGVAQIALLPVAYTKGTDFKRASRLPAETVAHWNSW